jgi:hypothetical protein
MHAILETPSQPQCKTTMFVSFDSSFDIVGAQLDLLPHKYLSPIPHLLILIRFTKRTTDQQPCSSRFFQSSQHGISHQ